MTPAENLAQKVGAGAGSPAEPVSDAGPFVVNLCSSSTPMALPQADLPELKQFKFFVSRRFEEGRERFRLHMGFFQTLAEAEGWLGLVREIYPGAWAGEAPGKKLRARAAAAAAEQAAHAAGPHLVASEPAPSPAAPPAPKAVAAVPAQLTARVPTLRPVADAPPAAEVLTFTPSPPPAAKPASDSRGQPRPDPAAVPNRNGRAAANGPGNAPLASSNIKEVLAALDEPDGARGGPDRSRGAHAPARAPAPLTDAQALKVLETRPQEGAKPAAFAVQLQWSVQPIALDKVPPLAIFSAYSLYCIEGSREGRKWHGLRLGFFNDPISAKQVASYVRSEFTAVAVVPVSAEERKRVSGDKGNVPAHGTLRKSDGTAAHNSGEFKLFDADRPDSGIALAAGAPAKKAPVRQLRPAPATRAAAGKVDARARRAPQTLEETLEILGAHELAIDDGKELAMGGGGKSHKADKGTRFTRLLERLGERVRKS